MTLLGTTVQQWPALSLQIAMYIYNHQILSIFFSHQLPFSTYCLWDNMHLIINWLNLNLFLWKRQLVSCTSVWSGDWSCILWLRWRWWWLRYPAQIGLAPTAARSYPLWSRTDCSCPTAWEEGNQMPGSCCKGTKINVSVLLSSYYAKQVFLTSIASDRTL